MNLPDLLLWGFIATVALSAILAAGQGLRLSRISLPFMLGTMVTPDRFRASALGLAMHMLNGWIFATLYAAAFASLGRAGVWLGAAAGLVHGLFVLLKLMPLLPSLHPRMASELHGPTPTRLLQPPGFLALHYGWGTPALTLLAHLVYGAILGMGLQPR